MKAPTLCPLCALNDTPGALPLSPGPGTCPCCGRPGCEGDAETATGKYCRECIADADRERREAAGRRPRWKLDRLVIKKVRTARPRKVSK